MLTDIEIAQSAKMLCEYRSDDIESLAFMQKVFERIFAEAKARGMDIQITRIGERPCMGEVDLNKIEQMAQICEGIIHEVAGLQAHRKSSSTDCNIPLSLGIPSLCIGVYAGGGAHTREEWVEKASLVPGLEVGIKSVMSLTENI